MKEQISSQRVGGLQGLFVNPFQVPVRLHTKKVLRCGMLSELLYAGTLLPNSRSRVIETFSKDEYQGRLVDFGKIDRIYGPLSTLCGCPPFIGSHGFITFYKKGEDTLYISTIAVPTKFFGTGIAHLLLDRLERIAEIRGISKLILHTRDTMPCYRFASKRRFFISTEYTIDTSYIEMTKYIHKPSYIGNSMVYI